jgi:hypothetical protein
LLGEQALCDMCTRKGVSESDCLASRVGGGGWYVCARTRSVLSLRTVLARGLGTRANTIGSTLSSYGTSIV